MAVTVIGYLLEQGLTDSEADIAFLVTRGLCNDHIANYLGIEVEEVSYRLKAIYGVMKVNSRAELIVKCLPKMGHVYNNSKGGS